VGQCPSSCAHRCACRLLLGTGHMTPTFKQLAGNQRRAQLHRSCQVTARAAPLSACNQVLTMQLLCKLQRPGHRAQALACGRQVRGGKCVAAHNCPSSCQRALLLVHVTCRRKRVHTWSLPRGLVTAARVPEFAAALQSQRRSMYFDLGQISAATLVTFDSLSTPWFEARDVQGCGRPQIAFCTYHYALAALNPSVRISVRHSMPTRGGTNKRNKGLHLTAPQSCRRAINSLSISLALSGYLL